MNYGPKGLVLTKSFEQCRLTAYQDPLGIWTIGWGHTGPEVVSGLTWTQALASGGNPITSTAAFAGVYGKAIAQLALDALAQRHRVTEFDEVCADDGGLVHAIIDNDGPRPDGVVHAIEGLGPDHPQAGEVLGGDVDFGRAGAEAIGLSAGRERKQDDGEYAHN